MGPGRQGAPESYSCVQPFDLEGAFCHGHPPASWKAAALPHSVLQRLSTGALLDRNS